jgi:hypothetical protein
VLFFWGKFSQRSKKKKGLEKVEKGCFSKKKKEPKSSHYEEKEKI